MNILPRKYFHSVTKNPAPLGISVLMLSTISVSASVAIAFVVVVVAGIVAIDFLLCYLKHRYLTAMDVDTE